MTRIIAGSAGGIRLDVPSAGTRPTSERVRESIFAALDAAGLTAGARVLDLYAGSGALGLEAVSRGAAAADLVERAGAAATVATRNAARLRRSVPAPVRVHRASADGYLRSAAPTGSAPGFDLVFLDPPYDLATSELTGTLALALPLLAQEATVVVERAKRSVEPDWTAAGLERVREKVYGDTVVWWAQPRSASQS